MEQNHFCTPKSWSWELRAKLLWAPQKVGVMDESGERLFRWDLQKCVLIRSEQPYGQSLSSLLPRGAVDAAWEHSEKGQDQNMDPGVREHSQPAHGLIDAWSSHGLCSEVPARLRAWLWV